MCQLVNDIILKKILSNLVDNDTFNEMLFERLTNLKTLIYDNEYSYDDLKIDGINNLLTLFTNINTEQQKHNKLITFNKIAYISNIYKIYEKKLLYYKITYEYFSLTITVINEIIYNKIYDNDIDYYNTIYVYTYMFSNIKHLISYLQNYIEQRKYVNYHDSEKCCCKNRDKCCKKLYARSNYFCQENCSLNKNEHCCYKHDNCCFVSFAKCVEPRDIYSYYCFVNIYENIIKYLQKLNIQYDNNINKKILLYKEDIYEDISLSRDKTCKYINISIHQNSIIKNGKMDLSSFTNNL